jgi:hypothetical protein
MSSPRYRLQNSGDSVRNCAGFLDAGNDETLGRLSWPASKNGHAAVGPGMSVVEG